MHSSSSVFHLSAAKKIGQLQSLTQMSEGLCVVLIIHKCLCAYKFVSMNRCIQVCVYVSVSVYVRVAVN